MPPYRFVDLRWLPLYGEERIRSMGRLALDWPASAI